MSLRTIVFSVILVMCASVAGFAQDRDWDRHDRNANSANVDMNSAAYRMGIDEGSQDRANNRQPMFRNHQFQNPYDQQAYQAGYQAGYTGNSNVGVYNDPRQSGVYNNGRRRRGDNDADDQNRDRDDQYRGYRGYPGQNSADDQAYQRGQQDGLNDGSHDAQTRHSFRATKTERYEDADSGYNSSYGDKNHYKQAYRQGYVQGYQQGFSGYANNGPGYGQPYPYPNPNAPVSTQQYPGAPVYGQPGYPGGYNVNNQAYQIGFQQGVNDGSRDAQTGHSFRATRTEAYEDADRGYNSSFGDKNQYKQIFRQGYAAGYQQGFNGGR